MALKGSIFKKEITDKILSTFEGSFLYNEGKEIRIPGLEDGQEIQIKVALTCAKTNVEPNGDTILPGELKTEDSDISLTHIEPTAEEKENVRKMMAALGL